MKDYISKNILHNDKLLINNKMSLNEVLNKYKDFYKKDYIELPLKVNDKVNFHINKKILEPLLNIFFLISNDVDNIRCLEEKFKSSTLHEVYNNLLIESYSSSRKYIENVFNKKEVTEVDTMADNVLNVMTYIHQKRKINKDNLNLIYNILTNDIDMGNNQLDGRYYRKENVCIGKNFGLDSNKVDEYMNDLFNYMNSDIDENSSKDLLVKIVIIHYYFEYIHPYYDFNGRTGRIVVLWKAINSGFYNELAFFSTAIMGFRDRYLSLFKKTMGSNCIDLTYFVATIIDILTLQKIFYKNVVCINKIINKNFNKSLSAIQKDILMWDQSYRKTYNCDETSLIKISLILNNYKEYTKQYIYREINQLIEYGVLEKSENHRNTSYKINYSKFLKK